MGKSKSDCDIIAFIFGYNPNADVLKVVGNKAVMKEIFEGVTQMLDSQTFKKVFPMYAKYEKSKEMFEKYQANEGIFKLKGSKVGVSFRVLNKETACDGTRYNYQFYDDVTQSNDKYNNVQHKKDIDQYTSQWSQRRYDENTVLRWFTGTAYSRADFLSYIKMTLSENKELVVDLVASKYYKWSRFAKLTSDRSSVIILVPGLIDLELGENKCYSSCPQKYSTTYFLKKYRDNPEEFMAMTQQNPMPSEAMAFDWSRLNQYDTLPKEILDNNCICEAFIDPAKKGKDNYCCLIFKRIEGEEKAYLVDCFYKKVSSKVAIPEICEKLAFHKVNFIAYEQNTTDIDLFEDKIKEQMQYLNWLNYSIEGVYSTETKEVKISMERDNIKEMIIFPMKGMYYINSPMGQALQDIVNYSFEGKVEHDDSIDTCCMYVKWRNNFVSTKPEIYDWF